MLDRKKSLNALIDAQNKIVFEGPEDEGAAEYYSVFEEVIMAIGLKESEEKIREIANDVGLEEYLHDSQ